VDDLADEESLSYQERDKGLIQIESWVRKEFETKHPFWNRFRSELVELKIPSGVLLGIISGVRKDIRESDQLLQIRTWAELDEYCQGVAGDVGEGVLCILGATTQSRDQMSLYAQMMGRCVQYLNIMRDLKSDFENKRIYVPAEFLKELGHRRGELRDDQLDRIRNELFHRAMNFRSQANVYSWKCFPAEMMVHIYAEAARTKWKHGDCSRLSSAEKMKASLISSGIFLRRIMTRNHEGA